MDKKYIECGKIINTHGCRGGVKVEPWSNSPKDLTAIKRFYLKSKGDFIEHKVLKASIFKQFVILEMQGIDDMEIALSLKGATLYAQREDFNLSEGEFFLADLIGLDVIDFETSAVYGKVKDIINRGASDIYLVDTPNGERMIPAVDEFIISVDLNKGVFVRVIEGLLD